MKEYFKTVGSMPKRNRREQRELEILARGGDRRAREELVRCNLGLVVRIANRHRRRNQLADAVAEGNLALVRAVDSFDPTRGKEFADYASWSVRRSVLDMSHDLVYVPEGVRGLARKIKTARRAAAERGEVPSDELIRLALGSGTAEFARALEALSLARKAMPEIGVCDDLDDRDERAHLRRLLQRLEVSEFAVLSMRYGVGGERYSRRRIASAFGGGRWAMEVERRALGRLRSWFQN